MTNIVGAAVAPLIGMHTPNTPSFPSTVINSAINGKSMRDESLNKNPNLPQLIFKMDNGQQQQIPFIPTSPSVTPVNNNYITSPNPNISFNKAQSITATQLTGVKNWWKNQMEYYSSDEEW